MTLNGRTALYCTNDASFSFGAYHINLAEDRPVLSAAKCSPGSNFRRYEFNADIRGGSVARGPQTTVVWLELAIFTNSGRHILGTFRVQVYVITRRLEVSYRLSRDPKCLTSNDFDMPVYAKICCYRRFD